MRRLLLIPAVLGALAAPAGAAQPDWDYSVTVEGEASYNRADVYDGETAGQHDHAFVFRTTIPTVRFHPDGRTTVMPLAEGSATVSRSHFALSGSEEAERFECSGGVAEDVSAGSLVAAGTRGFALRPLGSLSVRVSTCSEYLSTGALPLLVRGAPFGQGPMDERFSVSAAEVGDRVIVRTFSGDTRDARCPMRNPSTELCSLSYTATVTFERDDDPLVVPLVPEPPADDELFVPLVAKARLTPAAAVLPVACAADCAGSVVARAGGVLGRTRFAAKAGRTARVRVRLERPVARVRLVVTVGGSREAVTVRRG